MSVDFIIYPLLAGLGIALVAGPMGSLLVWRRMSNVGDTLAHSTLLGVSIALVFNLSLYVGLISVSLVVAAILVGTDKKSITTNDTILSILAYATLALGLILATLVRGVRIDLLGYLYGDILTVTKEDLIWIYSMVVVTFGILYKIWKPLLSLIVHQDLAQVEGVKVNQTKWIFMLTLAVMFAIAMKLIGILLMTALLIIPASAARFLSKTPEQMSFISSLIGIVSVCAGILVSYHWDLPTGPAIVMAATIILMFMFTLSKIKKSY